MNIFKLNNENIEPENSITRISGEDFKICIDSDGSLNLHEILRRVRNDWIYEYGSFCESTRFLIRKDKDEILILTFNVLPEFMKKEYFFEASNNIQSDSSENKTIEIKKPHLFFRLSYSVLRHSSFSLKLNLEYDFFKFDIFDDQFSGKILYKQVDSINRYFWGYKLGVLFNYVLKKLEESRCLPSIEISIDKIWIHSVDTNSVSVYSVLLTMLGSVMNSSQEIIDTIVKGKELMMDEKIKHLEFESLAILRKEKNDDLYGLRSIISGKNIMPIVEKRLLLKKTDQVAKNIVECLKRRGKYRCYSPNLEMEYAIAFLNYGGRMIYGVNLSLRNGVMKNPDGESMFLSSEIMRSLQKIFINEKILVN